MINAWKIPVLFLLLFLVSVGYFISRENNVVPQEANNNGLKKEFKTEKTPKISQSVEIDDRQEKNESSWIRILDNDVSTEPLNPAFKEFGQAIHLDVEMLNNLEVEDMVELPFGEAYPLSVSENTLRMNGTRYIRLNFDGFASVYRAFFTVGENAIYGSIISPEGSFDLDVVKGSGWMVNIKHLQMDLGDDAIGPVELEDI